MQSLKEVIGVNSSIFLFCYPRNKIIHIFLSFKKNTVSAAEKRVSKNTTSRVIHLMNGPASQILRFLNGFQSSFALWVMEWVQLAEALVGKIIIKIIFLEHERQFSLKCLPSKQEDLSWDNQNSCKKLGHMACTCNPSIGQERLATPQAHQPANVAELMTFRFIETCCLKI